MGNRALRVEASAPGRRPDADEFLLIPTPRRQEPSASAHLAIQRGRAVSFEVGRLSGRPAVCRWLVPNR